MRAIDKIIAARLHLGAQIEGQIFRSNEDHQARWTGDLVAPTVTYKRHRLPARCSMHRALPPLLTAAFADFRAEDSTLHRRLPRRHRQTLNKLARKDEGKS